MFYLQWQQINSCNTLIIFQEDVLLVDQKEQSQKQHQNQQQVQPLLDRKVGDKIMEHSTDHTQNNTLTNWILSALIGFFTLVETASADQIYTWTFRGLTLISLILMIIINWKKAWHTLFPKK